MTKQLTLLSITRGCTTADLFDVEARLWTRTGHRLYEVGVLTVPDGLRLKWVKDTYDAVEGTYKLAMSSRYWTAEMSTTWQLQALLERGRYTRRSN